MESIYYHCSLSLLIVYGHDVMQFGTSDGRVKISGGTAVESLLVGGDRSATKALCFLKGKGALLRITKVAVSFCILQDQTPELADKDFQSNSLALLIDLPLCIVSPRLLLNHDLRNTWSPTAQAEMKQLKADPGYRVGTCSFGV